MISIVTRIKQFGAHLAVLGLLSAGFIAVGAPSQASAAPVFVGGGFAATAESEICDSIGGCDNNPNSKTSLNGTLGFVVNLLSIVLGIAAVIMIIIGGIKYTTSNGDSNAISSAKSTIIYAVVGLIVAVLAKPLVGLVLGSFGK